MSLFKPFASANLQLTNKVVMAPMTRCRATADHVPTDVIATYYAQRASAGLIIAEGTSPSPNGAGYARIPGVYNQAQVEAWKKVTAAVHAEGGKIFLQLMHVGRVGHPANLPEGAQLLAPSAIAPPTTKMWVDQEMGELPIPTPKAMTLAEVETAREEFISAAKNAITAGFDGVEVHSANGYLLEQFLSPGANHRTDKYGGSVENRARLVLEVVDGIIDAIGADKVGIRLSPHGVLNEINFTEDVEETFSYLAKALNERGVTYVHLLDHSSMGAPAVPESTFKMIRETFEGTIIHCGGFDGASAQAALDAGKADLIAFGRPFIANPDLVHRMEADIALSDPNFSTFYTPGAEGYSDYPAV